MNNIIARRWETDTRYYLVQLAPDLLGDWILTRAWGGKGNRLGRIVHESVEFQQGKVRVDELHKLRLQHGYQELHN